MSKIVADYLNRGIGAIIKFDVVMDSNIQYCNLHLKNSHVEFIRRQSNKVAYELAKTTTSLPNFREIPTCINNLIVNKML